MLTIQKAALTIDDDGLHYGPVRLAKFRDGLLSARPTACRRLVRPEQAAAVDKAIAAWNRGDKTSALIGLVHLGAPELGPSPLAKSWQRHRASIQLEKAGFDPDQPRDGHGMWTNEGDPGASSGSATGGTVDDGVYHTTIGSDGKPVLPAATLIQAEVPEEETTDENGEESEEGILGLTPGAVRFTGMQNILSQLDPDSQFLETRYNAEDIRSGAAADDLEEKLGPIAIQRVVDFVKPDGQLIGQQGAGPDVREVPGGLQAAQAAFDYLTIGARDITPPGFKGKLMALPGYVGNVGLRAETKSISPALEINLPNMGFIKFHYIGE